MTGYLHSVQTLGTVDGPGVRSVAFLSGCPLRCICCHNPETWESHSGEAVEAEALAARLARYRPYFGGGGGVTVSGGEPLLQAAFVAELFYHLKKAKIHTALDTSGYFTDGDAVRRLLTHTDLVLLDFKYASDEEYLCNVGCSLSVPLTMLQMLGERGIPAWIRQVIIPGINDSAEAIDALIERLSPYRAVIRRLELLPFRKLCTLKYEELGIAFPLANTEEADPAAVSTLEAYANQKLGRSEECL